jgi:hypothetical protein
MLCADYSHTLLRGMHQPGSLQNILGPHTIVSWDRFETYFLEKFGDDKSLVVLVIELSSLKMNPKEKVKDFNQIFLTLKKKIPVDSMPVENLIVAYYTKALHKNIAICIKRSKKNTLLEAFEEAS